MHRRIKIDRAQIDLANARRFTLIELLIVVAIIGLLAAMLLPALVVAKDSANKAVCSNGLKQTNTATVMYTDDNDGYIPSLWCWWRESVPSTWFGQPLYQTSGLGEYSSLDVFKACPSETDLRYGLSEPMGSPGLGAGAWPPDPPDVRMREVRTPEIKVLFIDGSKEYNDDWIARPSIGPWGGIWVDQRRFGWDRHRLKPNYVCVDGHIESEKYTELDIITWSGNKWKP